MAYSSFGSTLIAANPRYSKKSGFSSSGGLLLRSGSGRCGSTGKTGGAACGTIRAKSRSRGMTTWGRMTRGRTWGRLRPMRPCLRGSPRTPTGTPHTSGTLWKSPSTAGSRRRTAARSSRLWMGQPAMLTASIISAVALLAKW